MRTALHLIDQRRWDNVAALVDPVALKVFRERRLEEARLDEERARESANANLRTDPDIFFGIQDYFLHSDDHEAHRAHGELRHTSGTSVEELERMTPAQLLGAALRARDPRGTTTGEPADATAAYATQLHPRRVIGEVIAGKTAYVLYTSQWAEPRGAANLAVLRRYHGGWALLPHGELFGQHTGSVSAGVAEPSPLSLVRLPIRQADWTSRTFRHQVPVDLLPGLLERLRGTPARLSELLAGTPSS